MAKREVDKCIISVIENFAKEVRKHYDVDKIIIFGSHVNGGEHEDSDIDVAVVSKQIKDRFDDRVNMMEIAWGIDLRIEPHPILTEDFENKATALVKEVVRTGWLVS